MRHVLLPAWVGGEKPAAVADPRAYNHGALSFSYPANWTVTTDITNKGFHAVMLDSPGNSTWGCQALFPQHRVKDHQHSFKQIARKSPCAGVFMKRVHNFFAIPGTGCDQQAAGS